MIEWPKPVTGLGAVTAWLNRFLSKARQCTPLESKDFRIELTSNGFYLRPKFSTTGGSPGKTIDANYKLMVVVQLGSSLVPPLYDLLICQEWNVASGSFKSNQQFYVAKDTESRRGIQKELYYDNGDNVTQQYSYFTPTASDASYGDNFRLAADGLNTELQVMEKRYYTKDMVINGDISQALIYSVDTGVPTGAKDPTNADITRIEVKPFRAWVRYATQ